MRLLAAQLNILISKWRFWVCFIQFCYYDIFQTNIPLFLFVEFINNMVWPLKLLCYYKIRDGRYAAFKRIEGIVVGIRVQMTPRLRWHTTLPRKQGSVIRQLQSRLYLQHGVAGKEARCPSKQGEVSYSTSWSLNENVLIWCIVS